MEKHKRIIKAGASHWKKMKYCVSIASLVFFLLLTTAYSYPTYLPTGMWCDPGGTAPYHEVRGVGEAAQGAGLAIGDIRGDGKLDLVVMAYDSPSGANEFRYKIGWDLNYYTGECRSWSSDYRTVPGVGWEGQGAGIALADIDNNGSLDMLLMAYDNPPTANSFRYKIGWNLDYNGVARSWSESIRIDGAGSEGAGAGIAIADINKNGRLDIVLMAYDHPPGPDSFRYRIGWDIGTDGKTTNWTPGYIQATGVSWEAQGADVAVADIDLDGNLDIVLMAYDSPAEWNFFKYRIGWHIQPDGNVKRWSRWFMLKGLGFEGAGAGLAYHYEDSQGPVLYFMAYDEPPGLNNFRYFVVPITTSGACFGKADDPRPVVDNNLTVPTNFDDQRADNLFNLNMAEVKNTAWDAVAAYWWHCKGAYDSGDTANHPECWYHYPDDINIAQVFDAYPNMRLGCDFFPDFLVAAVAWYVDQNMGYVGDEVNGYVLNTIHNLGYAPGGEGMPAYYIIHYTDPGQHPNLIALLQAENPDWASAYNDLRRFHGDCEDFAIMRHGLLRALGFDREYIWNVRAPGHEFNAVLYEGAYRLMDYGNIFTYLCEPSEIIEGAIDAWNEVYGGRWSADCPSYYYDHLIKRVYPDRCRRLGWAFSRRVWPDSEHSTCP